MILSGTMTIDPSQLTNIEAKKPTKVFGKLLYKLTLGTLSEKEEVESFTAISILQEINRVFVSMGINNIVRISKDGIDFYLDTEGKKDDLKEAMDNFSLDMNNIESELFNQLILVLEHEEEEIKYLIEIKINRTHAVADFPIEIAIDGLMAKFNSKNEDPKSALNEVFKNQQSYDSFVEGQKASFNRFIDKLDMETRKFIKVDQINVTSKPSIIRPNQKIKNVKEIQHNHDGRPVHYGYYGYDDYYLYSWYWAESMHMHNIHCHDVMIVDAAGDAVLDVGEEGFMAGEEAALNPDEDFSVPEGEDVEVIGGNEFIDESEVDTSSSSDGDSWFGDSSGGDFDSGSDASCSSCSSCGGD
ncbi:MAG: hypothetical protein D8M58_15980 [Calditrichaeota bacterium]|nr:MAG: hypothetical protein DWQ03_07710 [Calditrichota bacterium]MBL1206904.1 hypothetical protein [Calditrichota bacterium]NOG46730.1 hypothetical protein [Calditrichota bacterium]